MKEIEIIDPCMSESKTDVNYSTIFESFRIIFKLCPAMLSWCCNQGVAEGGAAAS